MTKLFDKVLVANRGEIARRVIRTCKRLGIRSVAVFSEADRDSPHVAEADEAVLIGPAPARDSYLHIAALVDAVGRTHAQAVHPGYGFLSENPAFARAIAAASAVFVGPPPEVLEAFGDKTKARRIAALAGTPAVPGMLEPIGLTGQTGQGEDLAAQAAEQIGYPIIVKAVGGGGGIGMQVVRSPQELGRALKTCSDRSRVAFADARVYLERYVEHPRHIEVQVLCDGHGAAYALGERDCSVQRRHQKIVEETPSPAPFLSGAQGDERRRALFESALRVVRSARYVGAGTCEFLADEQGNFFFLEVNARLQVEHPVTEMVTGLDLVEHQLRIAAGQPLPDLSSVSSKSRGHAIEVRVYAEDPSKGFLPRPGEVESLVWAGVAGEPQTERLRVESGVVAGSKVTPFYDPLLAKVIAWGVDRPDARRHLQQALATTRLGPCVTNLSFLREILAHSNFEQGTYDTTFAEALAKTR